MRVLVFGDLAQTGFGTVTMDLGHAMVERGEDVRFATLNEGGYLDDLPEWLTGRVLRFETPDGWLALPAEQIEGRVKNAVRQVEGIWTSAVWEDGWAPEAAIVIGDVGSVKLSPIMRFLPERFPVFHYVPIEGVALPPFWRQVWSRLSPIAMSEFGATQIEKVTGSRPPVVYHGVDTEVFRPATPERPLTLRAGNALTVLRSKADCKRFLSRDPNRLMLLRADRNVPRKRYPSMLRALAPVLARHPDVDLYMHCRTLDQGGDLDDDRSKYGPLLGFNEYGEPLFGGVAARMQTTGFHDRGASIGRDLLTILYNAADIYVSTASEGFGLTIAEAVACGTPAVALDFSAVPEVVGGAGLLVPPAFFDDNIYGHFWAGVDEAKFGAAVESLITSKGKRRDLGARGPIHVGAMFRWDRAAEQMSEILGVPEAVAA